MQFFQTYMPDSLGDKDCQLRDPDQKKGLIQACHRENPRKKPSVYGRLAYINLLKEAQKWTSIEA